MPGGRRAQQGMGGRRPHDRRAGPGDPVDLGQDGRWSAPRTSIGVVNGYYTAPTWLHLAEVGGTKVARTTPEQRCPAAPHAGGAPPRVSAPLRQGHGPLHHPPAALGGRAAVRDQLPHLRDLLHAAVGRSGALRAGRQPTPELVASIRHTLGLDKPWYVQYLEVHEAPRPPLRLRLQLPEQRLGQAADLRPPAGHDRARARRRGRVAAGRHPGRDHLRHQARHVDGPRCDGLARWSRSRRRSTGSASSRCTSSPRTSASSRSSRAGRLPESGNIFTDPGEVSRR